MAKQEHAVSSARADLAQQLNAAQSVREIKVGQLALNKLVKQAEALIAPDEPVEFGAYSYTRGITMVTYHLLLVTDRRLIQVNRTTWKLKPVEIDRADVVGVEIGDGKQEPQVTVRTRGDGVFLTRLVRDDAERLRQLLA